MTSQSERGSRSSARGRGQPGDDEDDDFGHDTNILLQERERERSSIRRWMEAFVALAWAILMGLWHAYDRLAGYVMDAPDVVRWYLYPQPTELPTRGNDEELGLVLEEVTGHSDLTFWFQWSMQRLNTMFGLPMAGRSLLQLRGRTGRDERRGVRLTYDARSGTWRSMEAMVPRWNTEPRSLRLASRTEDSSPRLGWTTPGGDGVGPDGSSSAFRNGDIITPHEVDAENGHDDGDSDHSFADMPGLEGSSSDGRQSEEDGDVQSQTGDEEAGAARIEDEAGHEAPPPDTQPNSYPPSTHVPFVTFSSDGDTGGRVVRNANEARIVVTRSGAFHPAASQYAGTTAKARPVYGDQEERAMEGSEYRFPAAGRWSAIEATGVLAAQKINSMESAEIARLEKEIANTSCTTTFKTIGGWDEDVTHKKGTPPYDTKSSVEKARQPGYYASLYKALDTEGDYNKCGSLTVSGEITAIRESYSKHVRAVDRTPNNAANRQILTLGNIYTILITPPGGVYPMVPDKQNIATFRQRESLSVYAMNEVIETRLVDGHSWQNLSELTPFHLDIHAIRLESQHRRALDYAGHRTTTGGLNRVRRRDLIDEMNIPIPDRRYAHRGGTRLERLTSGVEDEREYRMQSWYEREVSRAPEWRSRMANTAGGAKMRRARWQRYLDEYNAAKGSTDEQERDYQCTATIAVMAVAWSPKRARNRLDNGFAPQAESAVMLDTKEALRRLRKYVDLERVFRWFWVANQAVQDRSRRRQKYPVVYIQHVTEVIPGPRPTLWASWTPGCDRYVGDREHLVKWPADALHIGYVDGDGVMHSDVVVIPHRLHLDSAMRQELSEHGPDLGHKPEYWMGSMQVEHEGQRLLDWRPDATMDLAEDFHVCLEALRMRRFNGTKEQIDIKKRYSWVAHLERLHVDGAQSFREDYTCDQCSKSIKMVCERVKYSPVGMTMTNRWYRCDCLTGHYCSEKCRRDGHKAHARSPGHQRYEALCDWLPGQFGRTQATKILEYLRVLHGYGYGNMPMLFRY